MATSVTSAFQTLRQNLEITQLQGSTVSTRQQSVRAAVASQMSVLDSFVTGSYSRHTMIAPLKEADVDIFVVLEPSYYVADGHANLLDRVRRVLLREYPKTPQVSRNGQAVTITFTDFKVDVVPAFHRQGGGYLIPDSIRKTWIATDPKTHVQVMSDANAAHQGDLVPCVKMIKGWNRTLVGPFYSFYLELLARQIFNNVRISDYPSGVRYFFDKGRALIAYTVSDPVAFGGTVQGLHTGTVKEAVTRFETAYGRAVKAEEYTANGYTQSAINEWKKIFGDYFPSYG
jgi:hypothetical protein